MSSTAAAVSGATATGVILVVAGLVNTRLGHPAQALILVVPVVATAVVGGRHAAAAVAVVATVSFSLLLEPIGSPRVSVAQDVVALVVFFVVVFLIGMLVTSRVEALRRVERHHAALLRAVSHDLRTPLASIQAALSELEDTELHTQATRRGLATTARREAERLERLVGNLLSLARIEADMLVPNRQAVDIGELIELCTTRLQAPLHDIRIEVSIADGLPLVRADHALLEQVVTNLVENAARHTPPGAGIQIVAAARDDQLQIEILDEGPGMTPAELPVVFDAFRSGANPGTSGVGLAICKAVVEAHGGTIDAGNREPCGSAFRVVLPLA